jgi:hypothetical protein
MKQKTKSKVFGLKYLEKPSSSINGGYEWFHIHFDTQNPLLRKTATNKATSSLQIIGWMGLMPLWGLVADPAEPDEEMDYGGNEC